jgi:hypothetical protein
MQEVLGLFGLQPVSLPQAQAVQPLDVPYSGASGGGGLNPMTGIGMGALSGAGAGSTFGPWGAAIGAGLGGLFGLGGSLG